MYEINRSLIIVRGKEPFLHWLHSLPDPDEITLEEVNYDQISFMAGGGILTHGLQKWA